MGERFNLCFIKPSHYDDDGYVIQWKRTSIPSNTMAALYGIALDCIERKVLGEDVEIRLTSLDETNTRVRPDKIMREFQRQGGKALVGLVGVQSNQYPRAVDIARQFRAAGIPVCIGGFHVSGSLAMLPGITSEIQEAIDLGISFFAGEAEGRLEAVLRDAFRGELKPIYNFIQDLPGLDGASLPVLPDSFIGRGSKPKASFDSGRGCPFQCSFCTIINVQGRKSRYRSADDIEALLREHHARGIRKFFITDDNFARNKNWEAILDRVIELRENDGLKFGFLIQVDTLCHRIPNFVKKARRAGVKHVFIGLENINPDNLASAKKTQNQITEYRAMLQMWKKVGALNYCGYIIGFPGDTRERVLHDIDIIKRELPVDVLEFFVLTPLPGSQDHKELFEKGVPMDADLNRYDVEHATTAHPRMSQEEWTALYKEAWHTYYTPEHAETIMRRGMACGLKPSGIANMLFLFYGCQAIEGIHPLQGGLVRRKYRLDRRPELPIENPVVFYAKYGWHLASTTARSLTLKWQYGRMARRIAKDPHARLYMDEAITPVTERETESLELFNVSDAAKVAVAKAQKRRKPAIRKASAP